MTADDARKMSASELLDAYTVAMQDESYSALKPKTMVECNMLRAELTRRLDAGERLAKIGGEVLRSLKAWGYGGSNYYADYLVKKHEQELAAALAAPEDTK